MSSVLIPFFAAKCTISVAWACVVPMREQQRRFTGRQQSNGNQREHPKLSKMPCSGQQGGLEGGGDPRVLEHHMALTSVGIPTTQRPQRCPKIVAKLLAA